MSSQIVPFHRTNQSSSSSSIYQTSSSSSNANKKEDMWFDAFNFMSGQDKNIRWLSRPNQQVIQTRYSSHDAEKFRVTFDVENFQADQIKICIQSNRLTISGVYEEHSEGRFMQKQFERNFDLPYNADVDSMASFINEAHMLVVEIPLVPKAQLDQLSITNGHNDQRRKSFSLSKYNTSNQGLLSTLNDSSILSTPSGQQVRRSSITKTTTTTTSGSSDLSPEIQELLKSSETTSGNSTNAYTIKTTERHLSNTGNQQNITHAPNTSSSTITSNKQTTLTSSDLANLPIEIPPELLASGGTITIQKRKVSVTKGMDANTDHAISAITQNNNTQSLSSATTNSTHSTHQTDVVPINRSNDSQLTSSKTTSSNHSTHETGVVPIHRSNDSQLTSSKITSSNHSTHETGVVPIHRSNDSQSSLSKTTSNTSNQQQSSHSEGYCSQTVSNTNQSRTYTFEEFLQNKTWNPSIIEGACGKKIIHMRLQMKPGTKLEHMKISLNGYDLRVDVDHKVSNECGQQLTEHSYHQVTLFHSCEVDELKTELKDDGFLHIQAPINL